MKFSLFVPSVQQSRVFKILFDKIRSRYGFD